MSRRRPYRLGKRQASVDQTRRRILMAAVTEYGESGIDDTTMTAVARRADVASGTVLYHYPEPEALADAVVDMWIEEADLPDTPEVADGLSLRDRTDLLVATVFDMYDEDHPAVSIYLKNPQHAAMMKLQQFWDEQLNEVVTAILGPHLHESDRRLIMVIIGGQFLTNLARHGFQRTEVQEIVSSLLAGWLTSRPGQSSSRG